MINLLMSSGVRQHLSAYATDREIEPFSRRLPAFTVDTFRMMITSGLYVA